MHNHTEWISEKLKISMQKTYYELKKAAKTPKKK
jgi:hypothetical protein